MGERERVRAPELERARARSDRPTVAVAAEEEVAGGAAHRYGGAVVGAWYESADAAAVEASAPE